MTNSPAQPSSPSGTHPRRWLVLLLAWAAFTMTSLDRSVWGPAAPSVGTALGATLASLGTFATCYYVGYVVSNVLGGLASDAFGPRVVLSTSMVVAGAGMIGFGQVHSMTLGLVMQALVGFFAGADYSAGAKSIGNWFVGSGRSFAVALYTTATSLGTVIANLTIPKMIAAHGWRYSYHLFGAVSIALGVVIALLHRDHPAGDAGTESTPARRPFKLGEVVRNRDLAILALAGFCSLWGTYGFITWSNTLMIKGLHIKAVDAGRVVALFAITAVVMKPVVGWVSGRGWIARKHLAAAILLLFAVMLVVFSQLHGYGQFLLCAPLLGFAAYCYSPIQNALILDYAGHEAAGAAAGSLNAVWQLGSVIVPSVVGAIYSSTHSVQAAFWTLAAGPALAALLMLPLGQRFRDRAPDERST